MPVVRSFILELVPAIFFRKHFHRLLVDGVFDALCSHLEKGHEQLGRLEKKMERDRLTNGTLTEEKERNLEESRKAYEALLANVNSLASSLNRWELCFLV